MSHSPLRVAAVQQHVGDPSGDGELLARLGTLKAALDHLHLQDTEEQAAGREHVTRWHCGDYMAGCHASGLGLFSWIMLNQ